MTEIAAGHVGSKEGSASYRTDSSGQKRAGPQVWLSVTLLGPVRADFLLCLAVCVGTGQGLASASGPPVHSEEGTEPRRPSWEPRGPTVPAALLGFAPILCGKRDRHRPEFTPGQGRGQSHPDCTIVNGGGPLECRGDKTGGQTLAGWTRRKDLEGLRSDSRWKERGALAAHWGTGEPAGG